MVVFSVEFYDGVNAVDSARFQNAAANCTLRVRKLYANGKPHKIGEFQLISDIVYIMLFIY